MDHLTPLLTVLGHHIYLVGRPRQGQYAIPVSRSPGQGQGHRGQKKISRSKIFFSIFYAFWTFLSKKIFPYQNPKFGLRKFLTNLDLEKF